MRIASIPFLKERGSAARNDQQFLRSATEESRGKQDVNGFGGWRQPNLTGTISSQRTSVQPPVSADLRPFQVRPNPASGFPSLCSANTRVALQTRETGWCRETAMIIHAVLPVYPGTVRCCHEFTLLCDVLEFIHPGESPLSIGGPSAALLATYGSLQLTLPNGSVETQQRRALIRAEV